MTAEACGRWRNGSGESSAVMLGVFQNVGRSAPASLRATQRAAVHRLNGSQTTLCQTCAKRWHMQAPTG